MAAILLPDAWTFHLWPDLNEVVQENMEVEPVAVAANQEEEAPGPSQPTSSKLDLDEEQAGGAAPQSLTLLLSHTPLLLHSSSHTSPSPSSLRPQWSAVGREEAAGRGVRL